MTLGQLRSFLALAEAGSVRGAAEILVVSQPAVSSAVSALQRSLGVPLTEPDGRGLRLTEAGRTFASYARRVLALLEEGEAAAVASAAPGQGRLRVGAVTTAAESVVPALLAGFRPRYPDLRIQLEVGNRARVWDLLDHHEVDLVVGGRPPPGAPAEVRAVRPNEMILVGPPGTDPREGAGLGSVTWLLREPGSGTRAALEDILEHLEIDPPTMTLGSNGAIRESVGAGLGVSVLSRDAVAARLGTGALVEWPVPPFPVDRPWHAVTRSDRPVPPPVALLLDHLVDPERGPHAFVPTLS